MTTEGGPGGPPRTPPPSAWAFDLEGAAPREDLVAVGADLAPGTLLAAYRAGLFPMGVGEFGKPPLGWWSPDPRGVLGPGDLHISRSLRRSLPQFEIRIDTAFQEVLAGCADEGRPGRWITDSIASAYTSLHRLGWAHSVEAWCQGRLAGGLYGVAVGGLFAGESMFHRVDNASKVALVALVDHLEWSSEDLGSSRTRFGANDPINANEPTPRSDWLIDVQWRTDHLGTLGVRDVRRSAYLELIEPLLDLPPRWSGARSSRPSAVQRGRTR
ncbi:MAG: leucyl/phenylalanyl-tRNA--protein transferase [Ornithinimicrobium sp.]